MDAFLDAVSAFPPGPLLGLDLGAKTIGVAVSNPERTMAAPVATIKRTKFTADAGAMLTLATERRVTGLVVGLPVNMDGTEGPRAQSARAFVRNLERFSALPVALWDERLSTFAADEAMAEAGVRPRNRKATIDAVAASYILQGALDRMRETGESPAR